MDVCIYEWMDVSWCIYKRMYVWIYVCTYVCMYACMHVCMYAYVCIYVCIYVCTHVRMYICTYLWMYVHICIYTYHIGRVVTRPSIGMAIWYNDKTTHDNERKKQTIIWYLEKQIMTNKWEIIPTMSCLPRGDSLLGPHRWGSGFPHPVAQDRLQPLTWRLRNPIPIPCGLSPKKPVGFTSRWWIWWALNFGRFFDDSHTIYIIPVTPRSLQFIKLFDKFAPENNWACSLRHLILNTSRWNTLNSWVLYIYICVYNIYYIHIQWIFTRVSFARYWMLQGKGLLACASQPRFTQNHYQ